jgi:K+/H+ antiporter YhaU regulatory subunit KhtT
MDILLLYGYNELYQIRKKVTMEPRYVRIAIDLADSISKKDLPVGTKISGRSVLASRYNVSPETIRKAISLLKDYEVVSSTPKTGIQILNESNADIFLKDIHSSIRYSDTKANLQLLLDRQTNLNQEIKDQVKILNEINNKPKHANRFFPYELHVPEDSILIGKTIAISNFWHITHATIVSVTHGDKSFISPGPLFKFKLGDKIYFVCRDDDYDKTRSYIQERK